MKSKIAKLAIAAVVLIAALAVGVETLRLDRSDTLDAFSAEIRANTAVDLDPKAAIPLRQAQPEDFDVTWDGEDGGTLRIMPGSSLRLLAPDWREPEWEDVVSWAHANLAKVQESTTVSVSALDSRFAVILTSEGNLAVVEIGDHDKSKAELRWQVESAALPVYGPAQTVTLACVDADRPSSQPCAIDFDTGRTVAIASQTLALAPEEFLAWLQQNGIDAIARMTNEDDSLTGVGLTFQTCEPGQWAAMNAVGIRDAMAHFSYQPRDPILFQEGQYQLVHPFKTREGGIGILQMRGVDRVGRTVLIRYKMVQEDATVAIAAETQEDTESLQLARSAQYIDRLGRSVLIYASKNDDRMPQSIEEIRQYADSQEHYQWIVENVEYVGAGQTVSNPPSLVVAYDKTLLAAGKGTHVLFLDTHVDFVAPGRLVKLGVLGGAEAVRQQNAITFQHAQSHECLDRLGRSLLIYGSDNDDRLPQSLEEIRKHIRRDERYQWLIENVEYLGAGHLFSESPSLVVAYDRTLLAAGRGTYALFLDTHVEFIESQELAEHGLPAGE
ncbi:MAG: hypothetical protein ABFE13_22515 [Phycisphaerales bacterium]